MTVEQGPHPALREVLRQRLTEAMRARDRSTAGAVRNVLAALDNAEAVDPASQESPGTTSEHVAGAAAGAGAGDAPRRVLSADQERAVAAGEVVELRSAAAVLAAAGQHERGAELTRLAGSIEQLLGS